MVGTPAPGPGGPSPDAAGGTGGGSNGNNGSNGSGSGSNSGVLPDAASADAAGNGCINPVSAANYGDGHHNPGQDCMNACHNHGFTVAGTLYAGINSNTPVAGATIRVVDANNKTTDIVTQANGNFYISTGVTAPLTVLATSCPNIQPMTATVATAGGVVGCNQNNCHVSGNRIHLP